MTQSSPSKILIIGATLEKVETLKDKTAKMTFASQELTPENWGKLGGKVRDFVYLAIKTEDFKTEELELIEGLKAEYEDTGKSQSQRIRSLLYICWKKKSKGFEDFNKYYDHRTEKIINLLKREADD